MAYTVFFSWQSDTPTEGGRNFIERALSAAKDKLVEDLTIEPTIRDAGLAIDKDTRGIAGTPPIVDTIFKKIDGASAFVADLTFVGTRRDGRPTPNPNVLVEYGWALRSRGYTRIITLMNTAYGEPNDQTLPFNLKHLRWPITYHLPEGAKDDTKQAVRAGLAKTLQVALKAIVESSEFRDSIPKPAAVPKFSERQPADGPARFVKSAEPIGVVEGPFGIGGDHEVILADGPALWLRVIPHEQQAREWSISELRDNINAGGSFLFPLGNFSGWSYIRTAEGFGYIPSMANDNQPRPAVIIAFKSGEVWSVYSGPMSLHQHIPNIEPMFVECFKRSVNFLRNGLKIPMPYRWIAGIEGIKGKRLARVPPPGQPYIAPFSGPCLDEIVTASGLLNDSDKVQLGLRPFFQRLYDACGAQRPDHMDALLEKQFPE